MLKNFWQYKIFLFLSLAANWFFLEVHIELKKNNKCVIKDAYYYMQTK